MLIAASTGKRPLIRETEQFPAIISGTRGEGEEKDNWAEEL